MSLTADTSIDIRSQWQTTIFRLFNQSLADLTDAQSLAFTLMLRGPVMQNDYCSSKRNNLRRWSPTPQIPRPLRLSRQYLALVRYTSLPV